MLVLGILTAFQPGTSRLAVAARAKAAAHRFSGHRAVEHRVSGSQVSGVETASYAESDNPGFCGDNGYQCLNAWGGGPWVDVYTGGVDNNDSNWEFSVYPWTGLQGSNPVQIDFDGATTGPWSDSCVGDAYNESGYADTSLDPCGLFGGGSSRLGNSLHRVFL